MNHARNKFYDFTQPKKAIHDFTISRKRDSPIHKNLCSAVGAGTAEQTGHAAPPKLFARVKGYQ